MSGDYLADSPEHGFTPQDRLPDRCGFISDGMLCGYDRKCHEALWPREPAAPDDLAAFLAARYDEAEALARAVKDNSDPWPGEWAADGTYALRTFNGWVLARGHEGRDLPAGFTAFVAANDPAHRLADIALKRAILAEHKHYPAFTPDEFDFGCGVCHDNGDYGVCGYGWCATVRQLGTEFAEHAAYKQEWAP